jgi:hypothetical protein
MNPPAGAIAPLNEPEPVIGGMNPPAGAIASLNAPLNASLNASVAGGATSEINCRSAENGEKSLDLSALPIQTVQRPPALSDLRLRAIFPAERPMLRGPGTFSFGFGHFGGLWLRRSNSAFVLKVIALT